MEETVSVLVNPSYTKNLYSNEANFRNKVEEVFFHYFGDLNDGDVVEATVPKVVTASDVKEEKVMAAN